MYLGKYPTIFETSDMVPVLANDENSQYGFAVFL